MLPLFIVTFYIHSRLQINSLLYVLLYEHNRTNAARTLYSAIKIKEHWPNDRLCLFLPWQVTQIVKILEQTASIHRKLPLRSPDYDCYCQIADRFNATCIKLVLSLIYWAICALSSTCVTPKKPEQWISLLSSNPLVCTLKSLPSFKRLRTVHQLKYKLAFPVSARFKSDNVSFWQALARTCKSLGDIIKSCGNKIPGNGWK